MDWIRNNVSLVTLGVLLAVVLGAGAFVWSGARARTAALEQELSNAGAEIIQLKARAIFPSPENVEKLNKNNAALEGFLAPAVKRLGEAEAAGEVMNPIDFQTRLRQVRDQLTAECKDLVEIPPNFAFGFSRYENAMPTREATGMLTKQLAIVQELVKFLVDARVRKLSAIQRMPVEEMGGRGADAQERRPQGGAGDGADLLPGIHINRPDLAYTSMPFVVRFTSKDAELRAFVNRLAGAEQTPPRYVIRSVRVNNQKAQPPTVRDLKDPAKLQANTAFRSEAERQQMVDSMTTGKAIMIFGEESIDVEMRVDYVELRGPEAPRAEAKPRGNRP